MCVCVLVCSVTFVRTGRTLAKFKNVKNYVCRFWYLPSNGESANNVHHDLDYYFEGYEFWNVNISKEKVRASEKCSSMTFMETDICHRMGPLRMCTRDLYLQFQGQTFSCYAVIKKCSGSGCSRQICLDSHGPRREVAPVQQTSSPAIITTLRRCCADLQLC